MEAPSKKRPPSKQNTAPNHLASHDPTKARHWWARTIEDIGAYLGSSIEGLSQVEAQHRFERNGPNEIRIAGTNFFRLLVRQLTNPLILLLILAAGLSYLIADTLDFWLIIAVIVFQLVVTLIQEHQAERILRSLKRFLEVNAYVLRDGSWQSVPAQQLVVGDVVKVSYGDIIPADLRFFQVFGLTVSEAILTGESKPVEKSVAPLPEATVLGDRINLGFRGTTIVEGEGFGLVVATGTATELGSLSEEIRKPETPSPLQREVRVLSERIALVIFGAVATLAIVDSLRADSQMMLLPTMVALTVGSIPEGIPVALTLTLLLGAQRLLRRNVLIRNLSAVDSFARLDTVLLDKTGTITQGEVSLAGVLVEDELLHPERWEAEKPRLIQADLPQHCLAIELAALAFPSQRLLGQALTRFLSELGRDPIELRRRYPIVDTIPFNPFDKISRHLLRDPDDPAGHLLVTVGAPERVLDQAKHIWQHGVMEWLGDEDRISVSNSVHHFAEGGLYAVALGYKPVKTNRIDPKESVPLFALIVFRDPIRPDVAEVLGTLDSEGVTTYLVTGDHRAVAAKVAIDAGLITSATEVYDLGTQQNLPDNPANYRVYARVTPSHKRSLVDFFRGHGRVVGMIGDGVNDIPSLRRADVGVALGAGAEATKEAADMVLLNNDLRSLLAALQEGQRLIGAIQKIIGFLLFMALDMLVTFVVTISAGLPYPLTTAQILTINLFEDSCLSLGFILIPTAFRKRRIFDQTFSRFLLLALTTFAIVIALFTFFSIQTLTLAGVEVWRTLMFVFFYLDAIMLSLLFFTFPKGVATMFNRRHLPALLPLLGMALILIGILNTPFIRVILNLAPLASADWILVAMAILLNAALVELLKLGHKQAVNPTT